MTPAQSARAIVVLALIACSFVSCSRETEPLAGNPPMLIEPHLAVGKVRAGMNVQELTAKLGEPQRRAANSLEYTKLGFAVMPDATGVIRVVMCGDVTGIDGPLVKAFTGRTPEGLGLNSTREELVKIYGQPTSSERFPGGTESLRYDPLGITFTLQADKVYHMIIRLGDNPEPDRSVTLEPAPTGRTNQR